MKSAVKSEEIFALVQKIKERKGSLLTNFFVDAERLNGWLKNNLFYYVEAETGVLFLRKDRSFYHLYYGAASADDLRFLLNDNLPPVRLTTDIIGKIPNISDQVDAATSAGFEKYTQLERYTRINGENSDYYSLSNEVSTASENDAEAIAGLFEENFDALSEQVPELNDVIELIREKKVLVIKEANDLKGFLVRTFTGQTTVLNNFLVDPRFRGEKNRLKVIETLYLRSESREKNDSVGGFRQ